ncbi:ATP-binding protein [Chelatococcus sp. GCM10030263]|uniref:ATP-binding protein n=1 Tax=Chelatococcus sp. GCM10030263 TaxID=3273387 RepID=UPI00361C39F7
MVTRFAAFRQLAPRSIATRLLVSGGLLSIIILLLAGLVLSALYRRTTEGGFDERLNVYLTDLVSDLAVAGPLERKDLSVQAEPRFDLPLSGWYWQVVRLGAEGEIRTSRSLFGGQLAELPPGKGDNPGAIRKSYMVGPDDRELRMIERVIDVGEEGRYRVTVAAPADEIDAETRRFSITLAVTFVSLGLALALVTLAQVRYGLRPLARLRSAVADVWRGDAARIEGTFPRDIAPLADELNLLIEANREILERARTHVGNLAHALKTPLSVILNEADSTGGPLAEKVRDQATVMRDQINYYLDRARAAAVAGALGSLTDAVGVVDGLQRALERIYRQRAITITTSLPAGVRFRGEKQDFEAMVGNLLDNACKWAESTVVLRGDVEPIGDRSVLVLTIDDDGPGLVPEARSEVLRRGRRLDESKPGSGLGLAIVVELVGLYDGSLQLDASPLGGLRAVLRLPALAAAPQ